MSVIRHEMHFSDRDLRCFSERPNDVLEMLDVAVERSPDCEALVCGDQRLSWRKLERRVACFARGLRARGIEHGDRCILLVGNKPDFVIAMLGAIAAGAIAVPVSIRERRTNLTYIVNQCAAAAIVFDRELGGELPDEAACPSLRLRIVTEGGDGAAARFDELLGEEPIDEFRQPREEDVAVILYTSGTTGRPKGAMLTHFNIVHSAMHYEAAFELRPGDKALAAVPLSHVTGTVGMIMTVLRAAGTLIVLPSFQADEFLAVAARERMTFTVMVPAMYNLCLLGDRIDGHDLSAWRVGAFGGALMPTATIAALGNKLPGLGLYNVYGSTETTSPSTILPASETLRRADSVGLPVACGDVMVVDDEGRQVEVGEIGEVWIGGPMVVPGYWDNEAATRDNFAGGYWKSGDVGCFDDDGFLFVLDRKKDMVNRGGYKIYSAEVEGVLHAYPGVAEAAIVARPCPVLGERVHAFVAVEPGMTIDVTALQDVCAAKLADYKVPETIDVIAEPLPRNANGKVMKQVLRERIGVRSSAGVYR